MPFMSLFLNCESVVIDITAKVASFQKQGSWTFICLQVQHMASNGSTDIHMAFGGDIGHRTSTWPVAAVKLQTQTWTSIYAEVVSQ